MKSNQLAGIGILLGLAGAVLLALFVSSSGEDTSGVTAPVLIASNDGIPAGTRGDQAGGSIESREVPVDLVPVRAVATIEELAGLRAARPIGPGEIITTDQFSTVGPASGGVVVPEGWEAISIEARPAPGLEGYATTGARVNLYLTAETPPIFSPEGIPQPGTAQIFTQQVLTHTEVLAVTRGTLTGESQQADAEAVQVGGAQVFLLRVRPADVATLVFAQQQGTLWFTLVNADDPPGESRRFTFDDLDEGSLSAAMLEAHTQLEADTADEDDDESADDDTTSE